MKKCEGSNIKLLTYIIIVISLMSCKKDLNSIVSSLYGKEISFDGDFQTLQSDTLMSGFDLNTPIKVVAYLNSSICTPCVENYITVSSKFIKNIGSDSVIYVCILQSRPIDSLQLFLSNVNLPGIVVIIDTYNKYGTINSINKYNNMLTTYLLDSENRIVLIGDPLRSNKVRKIYETQINELIKHNGKKQRKMYLPARKV